MPMLKAPEVTHQRCLRCQGLLIVQFGIEEGDRVVCVKCSRLHYMEQRKPIHRNSHKMKTVTINYGGAKASKASSVLIEYQIKKIDGQPYIKIMSVRPSSNYPTGKSVGKNLRIRKQYHSTVRSQIFRKRGIKVMPDDDFFPVL